MINLAVASHHSENVERLSKILIFMEELKYRVIGIDGNGTGRTGALQRQDVKIAEVDAKIIDVSTKQVAMDGKIDQLLVQTKNYSKEDVKGWLRAILAILTILLGYLTYRAATKAPAIVHAEFTQQSIDSYAE